VRVIIQVEFVDMLTFF